MKFNKWLDTFLSEKEIQLDQTFTVQGKSGPNFMEVSHVVNAIKMANAVEQAAIKKQFILIDFSNGNAMHFIKHLAQAIAI